MENKKNYLCCFYREFKIAIFGIVLSFVLVYLLYINVSQEIYNNNNKYLLSLVKNTAEQFSSSDLSKIMINKDVNSPVFQKNIKKLKRFIELNPEAKSVYILRKTNNPNQLEFVVDIDYLDNDEDHNGIISEKEKAILPGDIYDASTLAPLMLTAFEYPIYETEIYEDIWGKSRSAYAPIYNAKGESVAILGADISQDEYNKMLRATKNLLTLIFIGLVIFSVYLSKLFVREKKIIKLNIKAEEEKKRIQELQDFKLALENSSNSIIITNKDNIIEYVNSGFEKNMGYTKIEAIGQNATLLQSNNPNNPIYKEIANVLKNKKTWIGELQNKRKNGEVFWEKATVSPIFNEKNQIYKFVTVKEDITKEVQIKENLISSYQELQKIDKKKNEFISIASHELRTPISVIKGCSSMILSGDLGEINSQQRQFTQKILNNTMRLINLVNDMLDLTQMETGTSKFNLEKITIEEIMSDLSNNSLVLNKTNNITLILNSNLGENVSVIADRNKLKQVFDRLLSNAIKFSNASSLKEVIIETYKDDKDYIKFSIKDQGVGIELEYLTHIFEKFSQVNNYLYRECEGSGLGLAITKKIINNLGGKIWVESELNNGSIFSFILKKDQ